MWRSRSLVSYQPSRMLFSLSYHLWPTNNAAPNEFFRFARSLGFCGFLSAKPRRRLYVRKKITFRSFVNLFQGDLLFYRFAHELKERKIFHFDVCAAFSWLLRCCCWMFAHPIASSSVEWLEIVSHKARDHDWLSNVHLVHFKHSPNSLQSLSRLCAISRKHFLISLSLLSSDH